MVFNLTPNKFIPLILLFSLFPASVSPTYYFPQKQPTKKVAFTFDDGPRPAATLRLRTILAQYHISATFFIVGRMAAKYPDLIRDLSGDGHEIANHTWSHPDIRTLTPQQMKRELDYTRDIIYQLTGIDTRLFRTPGSTMEYLTKWFTVPESYTLVLWDVHSLDHERKPRDEIIERIESQVKDGDIILFHSGVPSTVESLDCIIPELRRRGFEFLTVSEILRYRHLRDLSSSHPTIIHG